MFDLKKPPEMFKDHVLSEFDQNYMYCKPDVFMRQIDKEDELIMLGNRSFYNFTSPVEAAINLRNKLSIGQMPEQIRMELAEKMKGYKLDGVMPCFMSLLLNMDLIDI